jgi:hypothetical protein
MKLLVRAREPMPHVEFWSEGKLLESWKRGPHGWWVQYGEGFQWYPVRPGEVKMIVIEALKEAA